MPSGEVERRETIFALSSGAPPAAIAIVRVSGPEAERAIEALAGSVVPARTPVVRRLYHPETRELLDKGLVLFFPGPASATGEDLAEFHLHGGRAVVKAVEDALGTVPGLRAAEAGEFTRRAFENGRIDFSEAEGLADLLSAETESQRRNAIRMADGVFSRKVAEWAEELIRIAALIEARIEFADEDDVPDDDGRAAELVRPIVGAIEELLAVPPAERLRDGVRVVIAGPPNAGKSTLLNALVGREAAIATPIAGTTRDLIEVPVSIDGTPFLFIDSAGVRESDDAVEAIGIERARQAIASADIILWLGSSSEAPSHAIIVHNFADKEPITPPAARISISATRGDGIAALKILLVEEAKALLPGESEVALLRRQRDALALCRDALRDAARNDILLVAEGLRTARNALDAALGRSGGVEDMLDVLFGRFCIGK